MICVRPILTPNLKRTGGGPNNSVRWPRPDRAAVSQVRVRQAWVQLLAEISQEGVRQTGLRQEGKVRQEGKLVQREGVRQAEIQVLARAAPSRARDRQLEVQFPVREALVEQADRSRART